MFHEILQENIPQGLLRTFRSVFHENLLPIYG